MTQSIRQGREREGRPDASSAEVQAKRSRVSTYFARFRVSLFSPKLEPARSSPGGPGRFYEGITGSGSSASRFESLDKGQVGRDRHPIFCSLLSTSVPSGTRHLPFCVRPGLAFPGLGKVQVLPQPTVPRRGLKYRGLFPLRETGGTAALAGPVLYERLDVPNNLSLFFFFSVALGAHRETAGRGTISGDAGCATVADGAG